MRATLFAIDPGEKHCGTAFFAGGEVEWTRTFDPEELEDWLWAYKPASGDLFEVVLEEYRLYPWKAEVQMFSQMETCQTIGAVKFVCRRKGFLLTMARTATKKPTEAIMRRRGVELTGKNRHEKDAELHAYYRTNQRLKRGASA